MATYGLLEPLHHPIDAALLLPNLQEHHNLLIN
jgi:hypothetical protein